MAIKTFKRYERKYILNEEQYKYIIEAIPKYMELDNHCIKNGKYNIYNIYLDTENNDIIRRSISENTYKEKIRIRTYKVLEDENENVFLELKKKICGVVFKRRTVITYKEAINFISNNKLPVKYTYIDNQVIQEINHFLNLNKVYPKVYISYERIAYFAKDNKNFRLTFDSNIKSRRNNINFNNDICDLKLLEDGKYLMEVKINSSIPIWFVNILSNLKLYKQSFSKYGNEYKNYNLTRNKLIEGEIRNVR